ncbi:hypothetical protein KP509_08G058500 [Ceratopteris richardii]|uniref:Uncharacterized protein n=1 Tax=Ceratopteris richardii TaxID=49495 RepID=A0A8T2UAD0_CERRI|nr:hypothetical protein KP509_08G058500 [Ceratopteris richardii]KAH7431648.1 hypothetical protein KP509_08G058500 [Ceratopteris richardii]
MATDSDISPDTTCGSLLRELQRIWDEVGESDSERDKMLLQLEQECLEVYKRKVDQASLGRARLYQAIVDAEAEIASLISALGDHSSLKNEKQSASTLKEQLLVVHPQLEQLRKKRDERLQQFADVKGQIQQILVEIAGSEQIGEATAFTSAVEQDLSVERLEEYHTHLQALLNEKAERLERVNSYLRTIHDLCSILSMDAFKMISDVHPSLVKPTENLPKSISDETLDGLKLPVQSLQHERKKRLSMIQDLGTSLFELWNLMDTPHDERRPFRMITNIVGAKDDEVSGSGVLSLDKIQQAEEEVQRLDQLKASKMKELVMKKQVELDNVYADSHMEPDPDATQEKILTIIESGLFDASTILATMEEKINIAKQKAESRKEILDKVEKWISACEEESWLEDYNRDENRYNGSRGAHINLKRAEKARVTIQKLPALVDALIAKTTAWEEESGAPFLYDGMRLLDVLEEHNLLREEKEQERRRLRDQKRLQDQLATEQETLFGSRPSPHKALSAKKGLSTRPNGNTPNRRLSLGGAFLQTEVSRKNGGISVRAGKDKSRPSAPVNYVAFAKDDAVSLA